MQEAPTPGEPRSPVITTDVSTQACLEQADAEEIRPAPTVDTPQAQIRGRNAKGAPRPQTGWKTTKGTLKAPVNEAGTSDRSRVGPARLHTPPRPPRAPACRVGARFHECIFHSLIFVFALILVFPAT